MRRAKQPFIAVTRIEPRPQKFALTCSMRLPDGRHVSGRIEADSPIRDVSVRYTGAVNLLPFRCPSANTLVLRALFRSFAEDLKAQYEEVSIEKSNGRRREPRLGRRR
jgi:hypothetical protein